VAARLAVMAADDEETNQCTQNKRARWACAPALITFDLRKW
jgi:hypothetical protein